MLTYDMEDRGGTPLYEYLYRCIREDIRSGALPPGEKLPSKRALAEHLRVSVITVESAYAQLEAEGYVRAEPRRGFFAARLEPVPAQGQQTVPPLPREAPPRTYRADLKSNRVDPARFPFATWSRLMRQVLSEEDTNLLQPIPSQGVGELRRAIAGHLHSYRGLTVSPEQILVGAGTEYLYQLLIQLLGPELGFAVEDPGYPKLRRIYRACSAAVCPVGLDEQGLRIPELVASGARVAHISPSHHYPTGIVTPIARRYELLGWAGRQRWIIEDDYDSEFRFDGHPIATLQSIDQAGRVIYMNTFSQTISPSMRISYMVLPPELLERFRRQLGFYACTVPSFEQYTLARFIAGGWYEKHLSRTRRFCRDQRSAVLRAFRSSPFSRRVFITEHGAGLHFLMHLDTAESDGSLKARAEELGLRLSFLSEYTDRPRPEHEHTLVVNYSGLTGEHLREAVALLTELLEG